MLPANGRLRVPFGSSTRLAWTAVRQAIVRNQRAGRAQRSALRAARLFAGVSSCLVGVVVAAASFLVGFGISA